MNKVLVLAVHPDDETLGCGATLLKHKSAGDKIYWLIITGISENLGFDKKYVLDREKQLQKVSHMYKFDNQYRLDLPTMNLDKLSARELVEKISHIFKEVRPHIVYLPFAQDIHSDHRVAFNAAYSCTKTFRYPFIKKVFMMETISETEFSLGVSGAVFMPNYFVDVTNFLEKKLKIMRVYRDELNQHPFPRSLQNIKALATFRGAMAECKYAESFMVLKEIW